MSRQPSDSPLFHMGSGPDADSDALDALAVGITTAKVNWILDADIAGFLDPASYCPQTHEVVTNNFG